ncbi:MAG: hypothetical protein E7620_09510 [Ruminococcaceae bacterium]|nr:hypothetical protein [Oscillospiraceae bacterium]
MNRTFTETSQFNSDNGILKAFYAEIVDTPAEREPKSGALLEKLARMGRALVGSAARRMTKAFATVLSLVGLVGVVGAVEVGNLSPAAGLALGLIMVAFEYLCLKPKHRR